MIVYLSLLFGEILLWRVIRHIYKNEAYSPKMQKRFLIISVIAITFVLGSRYVNISYRGDINNYVRFYHRIINESLLDIISESKFEIGYIVFNKIIALFLPWDQAIMYVVAFICAGAAAVFIYKNTDDVYMGMICYIAMGTMRFSSTGFRQGIAISICLLSVEFIKNRKLIPFLLYIVFAYTFHKSAVIFIVLYPFVIRKNTVIINIVTMLLLIVFIYTSPMWLDRLMESSNDYGDYGGYVGNFQGNKSGGIVNLLVYTGTMILYLLYHRKNINKVIFDMLLLGTAFYAMRYGTQSMERIAFYFTPALCALMPETADREALKTKAERIFVPAVLVLGMVWMYIHALHGSGESLRNMGEVYKFFWENVPNEAKYFYY